MRPSSQSLVPRFRRKFGNYRLDCTKGVLWSLVKLLEGPVIDFSILRSICWASFVALAEGTLSSECNGSRPSSYSFASLLVLTKH